MKNIHPYYLHKNEDVEAYKRFAAEGMDLMHPVRIKGRSHRPDINIPYHATIKLFDTTKDKPEHAHEVASKLPLNPPNPKEVHIEPTTLKGRQGNLMHVIKLHGPHAENIKEHHKKFSHLGYKENYEYSPHITVDKATWDHIVNTKAKTAHDAGIEFMPAELHHKDKIVANYKPKMAVHAGEEPQKDDKLAASERFYIVRETIGMHIDLKKHEKALILNDLHLSNYLQDNPELKEKIIQKHEKRLEHHFGNDLYLINLAWKKGMKEAYKEKNRK
jgi:hypothetical protein